MEKLIEWNQIQSISIKMLISVEKLRDFLIINKIHWTIDLLDIIEMVVVEIEPVFSENEYADMQMPMLP